MEVHMDSLNKFWQNFEKQNVRQKTKWLPNHKIEHNSLISWATESRFRMEFRKDSLNKFWKTFESLSHPVKIILFLKFGPAARRPLARP